MGLAYCSGELPAWFYGVWNSLQTVAPYKDSSQEAVRPLGLKNSLTKLFNKEVMVQSKPELREFLEPVQVGLSVAGAALLTRSVSGVMHTYRDFICFRLDLKNAFNEMSRRAVLDVLNQEESRNFRSCYLVSCSPSRDRRQDLGGDGRRNGPG